MAPLVGLIFSSFEVWEAPPRRLPAFNVLLRGSWGQNLLALIPIVPQGKVLKDVKGPLEEAAMRPLSDAN